MNNMSATSIESQVLLTKIFSGKMLHNSIRISDNFEYSHGLRSHIDLCLFKLSNGEGSPLTGQFKYAPRPIREQYSNHVITVRAFREACTETCKMADSDSQNNEFPPVEDWDIRLSVSFNVRFSLNGR